MSCDLKCSTSLTPGYVDEGVTDLGNLVYTVTLSGRWMCRKYLWERTPMMHKWKVQYLSSHHFDCLAELNQV